MGKVDFHLTALDIVHSIQIRLRLTMLKTNIDGFEMVRGLFFFFCSLLLFFFSSFHCRLNQGISIFKCNQTFNTELSMFFFSFYFSGVTRVLWCFALLSLFFFLLPFDIPNKTQDCLKKKRVSFCTL